MMVLVYGIDADDLRRGRRRPEVPVTTRTSFDRRSLLQTLATRTPLATLEKVSLANKANGVRSAPSSPR